jgi:glucokinase
MNRIMNILGVDIGGTKCAVIYGIYEDGEVTIADKIKFPTTEVKETIEEIIASLKTIMQRNDLSPQNTSSVGISCGGPLDSVRGIVMSPPNLPGWDNIRITEIIEDRIGVKAKLQNDANAGALAEWHFGAGKGTRNMVFLTCGTGLGGGIIADGHLYEGSNGNAGEFGHIRMNDFGPVGYGKSGSFEGFVSGSGIAQLARSMISEKLQRGEKVAWCNADELDKVTAKKVAEEAKKGDELAKRIYNVSGYFLGKGLSIIIDILNPEMIVIGGIYSRCTDLMEPAMNEAMHREALSNSLEICRIVPAALGESIGDYAAISVGVL